MTLLIDALFTYARSADIILQYFNVILQWTLLLWTKKFSNEKGKTNSEATDKGWY